MLEEITEIVGVYEDCDLKTSKLISRNPVPLKRDKNKAPVLSNGRLIDWLG